MRERVAAVLIAFGSGFVVLVVELVGARLLGPTFGVSVVPWTAVISVVLAGLALGNWIGGRIADHGGRFLHLIFLSAAGAVLLPLPAGDLTLAISPWLGTVAGVLVSSAILFAPAAVVLGCVVPYLIRRSSRTLEEVGTRTGDIGAAATAGSIAGTLTTGFVLIPAFRLDWILAGAALLLLALAAVARWWEGRLLLPPPGRKTKGVRWT